MTQDARSEIKELLSAYNQVEVVQRIRLERLLHLIRKCRKDNQFVIFANGVKWEGSIFTLPIDVATSWAVEELFSMITEIRY